MTGHAACSSVKEFTGCLSHSTISFKQKVSVQLYHDSKKSWSECLETLRSAAEKNDNGSDAASLMVCAVTLKHHAYNNLKLLYTHSDLNPWNVALEVGDVLINLCLLYSNHDELLRHQIMFALCGVIINFFDVNTNDNEFMLNIALRRFESTPKLQCELLRIFPDEVFNLSVHCSSVTRADIVRGSVMSSPRIMRRLFEMMEENAEIDIMEPLKALQKWLELHVNLVRTFEGTHAYVHDDDHGKFRIFNHDSMFAKIPMDDGVLIRNGLNAIYTVNGIFTLFEMVKESIEKWNADLCEVVCECLSQIYSLIQLDLLGLLLNTSNRYNDSVSQSVRHWTMCSKIPVSQLPALVTSSCSWAITFFADIKPLLTSILSFRRIDDEEQGSRNRLLINILELLVTISGEHIAYTLLFVESQAAQATAICNFVKDALTYPNYRCKELCLDFFSSLMSVLFAVRDGMSETNFSTCVLRIVQTMRSIYTDVVKQVIKTVAISLDGFDEELERYRNLVLAFIDEALHIVGINVILQMLQDLLRVLSERLDWAKAETGVFLVTAIAHRLTPDLSECIVMKMLSIVCNMRDFKEFYEKNDVVALYVHKSICDCLVLTAAIVAQDHSLMKAAQEMSLMEFCESALYGLHAARALRALKLCANDQAIDTFKLLQLLSKKVVLPNIPFDARIELLGCMVDLIGSLDDMAKMRLRRDFVGAMSQRLNKLLDVADAAMINQDVGLYLATIFLVDFRPCFTLDVNVGSSNEVVEDKRSNHEISVIERMTQLSILWPYVNFCQKTLKLEKFSTSDEIENLARWLLWLLKESHFGSTTQLLVLKTILQSVKLCQHETLLNRCMDIVDRYVSRLVQIATSGVETLDAEASVTPRNNYEAIKEDTKNMEASGSCEQGSTSLTEDSEAERMPRSNQVQAITDFIALNAKKFKEETDMSELDLFTSAIRAGVSNEVSALKLLSWPKFGKYVSFMALLLPSDDMEINKEIMELFVSIILWTSVPRRNGNEAESQKQKLTRNAAKALLIGKHFIQCNLTLAEFIISYMFKALLEQPCRVEEWLSPATRIFHTLIASSTFYPVVTSSIKSCVRGSPNKRRKVIARKISMSSSAREVRQLLWSLATDNPEPRQLVHKE